MDADPEGLHQLRVAYRRLRSALSLHRAVCRADPDAQDLKDRLRSLTVPFGAARDLDVFVDAATASLHQLDLAPVVGG